MINKFKLKGYFSKDKKAALNNATTSDSFVVSQLQKSLRETEGLVSSQNVGVSIPFIMGQDMWNRHSAFGTENGTFGEGLATDRYTRGAKVFVDFGYGLDRELSGPHPAIILYNLKESVVVIPTSTDDGKPFAMDLRRTIIRCHSDGTIFPSPTVLYLHQIRLVSKNRILKNLGCNVKGYQLADSVIDTLNKSLPYPVLSYGDDLLKCIEVRLAYAYSPDTLYEIKRLHEEMSTLREDIKAMQEQIALLEAGSAYKLAALGPIKNEE